MAFDFNKFKNQGALNEQATATTPVKTTGAFDFNKFKQKSALAELPRPEKAPQKSFIDSISSEPTFKAGTGEGTFISNVGKTIGNIPSSAARLARATVAPVNPLDTESPVNIGKNIVESVSTAKDIVETRGVKKGVQDFAAGFNELVNRGGKKAVDFIKSIASMPAADIVEELAKVGVEDPLFIPSLVYAPSKVRGTGVAEDLISKAGGATLKEGANIASDLTRISSKVLPEAITSPILDDVTTLRAKKISQGLVEQNNRLKSVGNSFVDNSIVRKLEDGTEATITPIDTFAKYNVAPKVENGTINMGDWDLGTGELGKLKNAIDDLDNQIGEKLGRGQIEGLSGQEAELASKAAIKKIDIDDLELNAIRRARADATLKREGLVESTVKKLENQFADYRKSYGKDIDLNEINEIRKVQNRRFDPETVDSRRIVGDIARDVVYNATDDKVVKSLLQQQGEILAARNYAQKLNGTKASSGGKITVMAMRAAGAALGGSLTKVPIVGEAIGALGMDYVAKGLQQAQFRSLPAEIKALFQSRSTKSEQIINPKIIPTTDIKGIVPRFEPKSKTLKTILDYIRDPKLGASVKAVKINREDVEALKKIAKAFDEQAKIKGNLIASPKSGFNPKVEQEILQYFGIKADGVSLKKIVDKIDNIVDQAEAEFAKKANKVANVKTSFKQNPTTGKMEGSNKRK